MNGDNLNNDNIKRIIITGAGGMIGTALAEFALDKGVEVYAVVRPGKGMSFERNGLHVVECDLSLLESCDVLSGCDAFFHLAWDKTTAGGRDDADTQLKNIGYTLDAVRLAKKCGCKVFVGAGSQAEYGITDVPLNGNTPVNPQSGYGIAKYAAGKMSALLCGQLNIRHCWTRILSVYGERDRDASLISYCVDSFINNIPPELTPCGQIWDYIYRGDAAKALFAVAERGINGRVYPVGSGQCAPLWEYVEKICKLSGSSVKPLFGAKDYYPHQPMYLCADISELTADTGFVPTKSFEEGISKVIAYRRQKTIKSAKAEKI